MGAGAAGQAGGGMPVVMGTDRLTNGWAGIPVRRILQREGRLLLIPVFVLPVYKCVFN